MNQLSESVQKVFKTAQKLTHLYERWLDEQEYEDINDYGKVIKQEIEKIKDIHFIRMIKRPYGFVFICDNKHYAIGYRIKGNRIEITITNGVEVK